MKHKSPDFSGLSPTEVATQLDADRKRMRGVHTAYGAVYLGVLALYFIDTRAMTLLFFANILMGFLIVKPQNRAYQDSVLHARLLLGLSQEMTDLQHSTKGGLHGRKWRKGSLFRSISSRSFHGSRCAAA